MALNEDNAMGLIWGVEAIAKVIGRTHRQTSILCQSGAIPAKKMGERWVIRRDDLERAFSNAEDAA